MPHLLNLPLVHHQPATAPELAPPRLPIATTPAVIVRRVVALVPLPTTPHATTSTPNTARVTATKTTTMALTPAVATPPPLVPPTTPRTAAATIVATVAETATASASVDTTSGIRLRARPLSYHP